MCLHTIAATQKAGGVCAFIDAEHSLDIRYAKNLGVDVGSLLVSQPDCGEQALEIADQLARTGAVDLIVVDSIAALVPRAVGLTAEQLAALAEGKDLGPGMPKVSR